MCPLPEQGLTGPIPTLPAPQTHPEPAAEQNAGDGINFPALLDRQTLPALGSLFPCALLFVFVQRVNYSVTKLEMTLKCLAQESPLGATGIKMQEASELSSCLHMILGETRPLLTSPWSNLFIL